MPARNSKSKTKAAKQPNVRPSTKGRKPEAQPKLPVEGHRDDVRKKGLPPWLVPGNPGHKGGTGRPPNEIRQMFREIVSLEGVAWINEVLNDPERSDKAKKEALELAAKLSLGFKSVVEEDMGNVDLPPMTIAAATTPPPVPDDL